MTTAACAVCSGQSAAAYILLSSLYSVQCALSCELNAPTCPRVRSSAVNRAEQKCITLCDVALRDTSQCNAGSARPACILVCVRNSNITTYVVRRQPAGRHTHTHTHTLLSCSVVRLWTHYVACMSARVCVCVWRKCRTRAMQSQSVSTLSRALSQQYHNDSSNTFHTVQCACTRIDTALHHRIDHSTLAGAREAEASLALHVITFSFSFSFTFTALHCVSSDECASQKNSSFREMRVANPI